jgi:hypothetical protein
MHPGTKLKLNIIIDIALFIFLLVVAVIGFIIRYILIPGSDRWVKFGYNAEMTFLNLERHEWGYIHWVAALVLAGLLVLHLIFHWTQILCMVKRLIPNLLFRKIAVVFFVVLCVSILVFPVLIPAKVGEPVAGQGFAKVKQANREISVEPEEENGNQDFIIAQPESEEPATIHKAGEGEHVLDIRGFNTLDEIAGKYNISVSQLKQRLKIPADVPGNQQLGRIRRVYGFTMADVEDAVLTLQKTSK